VKPKRGTIAQQESNITASCFHVTLVAFQALQRLNIIGIGEKVETEISDNMGGAGLERKGRISSLRILVENAKLSTASYL
jgi:hypothetical protein